MKFYRISGTEIGAILGLSPYMTPMDLYMRKLGLAEREPENEPMKWGIAAEHVVARRYAKETKQKLYPEIDEGFDYSNPLVHPDYPWWTGTPDRQIGSGSDAGLLEIKIVGERTADQWGEAPDGDVPESYLTQVCWYMPLLGVEWADLAVQIGNRDYRVFRINRDRELENQLRDAALAFIENHLIPEIPPEIDGSESSKRFLNYKFPQDSGPMLEPTDAGIIALIRRYEAAKGLREQWEGQESQWINELKAIIGDCSGLKGPWGKITWKRTKNSKKINWEQVALNQTKLLGELHPDDKEILDKILGFIDQNTTTKPGTRRFLPKFKGE